MGRLLDTWKAARSAHKELSDQKQYKTDLAPLLQKYEGIGEQRVKINEQSNKLEAQVKADKAKNEAQRDAKVAAIDAARTKVVDATRAASAAVRKILDDSSDWETPLGPSAAKYDDFVKKYQLLQKQREKAETDFDAANKALDKAFTAKQAALDQAEKKLETDRKTLRGQLDGSLARYRDTAKKNGNSNLADQMDRIRNWMAGLP